MTVAFGTVDITNLLIVVGVVTLMLVTLCLTIAIYFTIIQVFRHFFRSEKYQSTDLSKKLSGSPEFSFHDKPDTLEIFQDRPSDLPREI